MTEHTADEKYRIENGWQCPKCFGADTQRRYEHEHSDKATGYLCRNCGCQWSRKINVRQG